VSRHGGFGFRIDYDLAIAQDERVIAWAERSVERGWYVRTLRYDDLALGSYEADELWKLAIYFPDSWTSLGLTGQDVADLASSLDLLDEVRRHSRIPDPQSGASGIRRGDAIVAELEVLSLGGMRMYRDEVAARADLRRSKASLARHRRNRDKYGGVRTASNEEQ
jgi:hypothetical protein